MATCSSVRVSSAAALAFLLAAGPLAGPAPAQTAVAEVAQFAGEIKAELKALKQALDVVVKDFDADFKVIKDGVKAGTKTPDEAHDELFSRLDELFSSEDVLLRSFTDAIETDATLHLEQILLLPNAMTVGDGGLIDGALHSARALVHAATAKVYVKVHAFGAKLQKNHHYDLVVDRRAQIADPMTPSEDAGSPAPAPKTMLRIDILLAGSDRDLLDDARICVAGTADPDNGADIDVTLTRPGQAPVLVATTVDNATHRWQVRVPASLPGTLTEGNYAIDVTQGGVTISDSIGVQ